MALPRQSISLTPPNEEWLRSQVESQEYSSKSEVVNDLIRRQRELQYIRSKLAAAEKSGFTSLTREQILTKSKDELRQNGEL